MEKLRINYADFIICAIVVLNDLKKRRIISSEELNIIKTRLEALVESKNKDLIVTSTFDVDLKDFETHIEEVNINNETIYRLKPQYNIEEVRKKFIGFLPTDIVVLLYTKDLYEGFDDKNIEKEKYTDIFCKKDEEYQLKLIHEIFELEKKRRKLNSELRKVYINSTVYVDDLKVDVILEKEPDINCDSLIKAYQKKDF